MPALALTFPDGTAKREHATRFACQLYLYGGADGKPVRGVKSLARIVGCADSTISRAMQEDKWEQFALSIARNTQLGALSTIRTRQDRIDKLDLRLDTVLADYLATDSGTDDANTLLSELERLSKLVGHDKALAIDAKVLERKKLDQYQAEKAILDGNGLSGEPL